MRGFAISFFRREMASLSSAFLVFFMAIEELWHRAVGKTVHSGTTPAKICGFAKESPKAAPGRTISPDLTRET